MLPKYSQLEVVSMPHRDLVMFAKELGSCRTTSHGTELGESLGKDLGNRVSQLP